MRQGHCTPSRGVELLLERLSHVHPAGPGRWRATCPAHGTGKNQALSLRLEGEKVLLYCFAGCPSTRVLEAVGLTWADLYHSNARPWETSRRVDPRSIEPESDHTQRWQKWWDGATPQHPLLKRYLQARGLTLDPPSTLRLASWGQGPTVLARVEHPVLGLVGMHLTVLAPDGGTRLSKRLASGSKPMGGAIRLYEPLKGQPLALTEGVETGLAVHQATGWPVWACVSALGLERVVLPPQVLEVVIAADHDGAGLEAANKLARRLFSEGHRVRVATPPEPGQDWLDVVAGEVA